MTERRPYPPSAALPGELGRTVRLTITGPHAVIVLSGCEVGRDGIFWSLHVQTRPPLERIDDIEDPVGPRVRARYGGGEVIPFTPGSSARKHFGGVFLHRFQLWFPCDVAALSGPVTFTVDWAALDPQRSAVSVTAADLQAAAAREVRWS